MESMENKGRPAWKAALGLVLALGWAGAAQAQTVAQSKIKKVILFDKILGSHAASKALLRASMNRLATQYKFTLQITENSADLSEANLATAQILVFGNNDGDGVVPTGPLRTGIENFVQVDGKGVVLVHAATAYINAWPFLANCAVQQYFHHNNSGTTATIFSDSGLAGSPNQGKKNPETANIYKGLPITATMKDEWYMFRDTPRKTTGVNVLISADEKSFTPVQVMGDHPLAWTRKMGKGIAVANSIGHDDVFTAASNYGDKLMWNLMRYAAKDFVGCMDAKYKEYNPDASVDASPTACQNLSTGFFRQGGRVLDGEWASFRQGSLRVSIVNPGAYRVTVTDIAGRQVQTLQGSGSGELTVSGLKPGMYQVKAVSGGHSVSRKVMTY